jgi:hypothetical protein
VCLGAETVEASDGIRRDPCELPTEFVITLDDPVHDDPALSVVPTVEGQGEPAASLALSRRSASAVSVARERERERRCTEQGECEQ